MNNIIKMVLQANKTRMKSGTGSKSGFSSATNAIDKNINIKSNQMFGDTDKSLASIKSFKLKQNSYFNNGGVAQKNTRIKQKSQYRDYLGETIGNMRKTFGSDVGFSRQGKNLNFTDEFQQYQYKDTGAGIAFKGVDVVVPTGFIKKGNTIVSATDKQYLADYENKKVNGERKIKNQYLSYTPTEAILSPEGKLLKVIKRDDYESYNRQDDVSKQRRREVFDKEVSYFDPNNFKQKTDVYGDYLYSVRESPQYNKIRKNTRLEQSIDYGKREINPGSMPKFGAFINIPKNTQKMYTPPKPQVIDYSKINTSNFGEIENTGIKTRPDGTKIYYKNNKIIKTISADGKVSYPQI